MPTKKSPWEQFERAGAERQFFPRRERGGREDGEQSRSRAVAWTQIYRLRFEEIFYSCRKSNLCNKQTSMGCKILRQFQQYFHRFVLSYFFYKYHFPLLPPVTQVPRLPLWPQHGLPRSGGVVKGELTSIGGCWSHRGIRKGEISRESTKELGIIIAKIAAFTDDAIILFGLFVSSRYSEGKDKHCEKRYKCWLSGNLTSARVWECVWGAPVSFLPFYCSQLPPANLPPSPSWPPS